MKKLLTTGIAFTLVLAMLAGCGGTQAPSSTPGAEVSTSSSSASQSTSSIPEASSIPEIATAPKAKLIGSNLYTYVAPFTNGYAFVSNGTEWGYVDMDGKYTPSTVTFDAAKSNSPFKVDDGSDYEDEMAFFEDYPNPLFVSEEGLYPYCKANDSESHDWGFKDIKTEGVVIDAKYRAPAVFNNGRAVVTEIIISGGSSGTGTGLGADHVSSRDKVTIIDPDGKVIKEIGMTAQPYYKNGIFMARGLNGNEAEKSDVLVMDVNGKEIFRMTTVEYTSAIPDIYRSSRFEGEFMNVMGADEGQPMFRRKADGGFNCMNADGTVALEKPEGATNIGYFVNNRAFAKDSGKLYALIDNKGTLLTDYKFSDYLRFTTPEYTLVQEEGIGWYPIDNTGKRMGEAVFDDLCYYPQADFMTGTRAEKCGAIDPATGKEILPFVYDDISQMVNGLVWLKEGETYSLCDLKGVKQDFMTATGVTYIEEDSFAIAVEGGLQIVTIA